MNTSNFFPSLKILCHKTAQQEASGAGNVCSIEENEAKEEHDFCYDYPESLGLITSESTLYSEAKALRILLENY